MKNLLYGILTIATLWFMFTSSLIYIEMTRINDNLEQMLADKLNDAS